MRVLVLGSGVIGTTSAYYLARAGFQVTVVDRQPAVGMETSFANAGQVSPGYASPWAAPGVPLKAIKWLLQRHSPLAIKATANIDQYLWMAQMLRNCTASRYAVNKERMVRLSEYSRDCLDELRIETGIAYEGRSLGTTSCFGPRHNWITPPRTSLCLNSPACLTSCWTARALPVSSLRWPV